VLSKRGLRSFLIFSQHLNISQSSPERFWVQSQAAGLSFCHHLEHFLGFNTAFTHRMSESNPQICGDASCVCLSVSAGFYKNGVISSCCFSWSHHLPLPHTHTHTAFYLFTAGITARRKSCTTLVWTSRRSPEWSRCRSNAAFSASLTAVNADEVKYCK